MLIHAQRFERRTYGLSFSRFAVHFSVWTHSQTGTASDIERVRQLVHFPHGVGYLMYAKSPNFSLVFNNRGSTL